MGPCVRRDDLLRGYALNRNNPQQMRSCKSLALAHLIHPLTFHVRLLKHRP
jgi:hypothetical protein